MSGLLAMALGLAAAAYVAWPWLWRRPWRPPADGGDVRHDEDLGEYVNAIRDWSLAAGEIDVENPADVAAAPTAGGEDE